ncbi:hypothetical protein [Zoogloea sp.]|uniref:hypothetical protein n=1 Tax=Zoogloea sp. TaxID=49181 RepID=UPI002607775A|nr:hypothetical protein [uncultured Zoogloea sp.]
MRRTIAALLLSAWAAAAAGAPGEAPEADCERVARRLALARDEVDRAKQIYDREMSQDSMTAYYRAQFELAAAKGEAAGCERAAAAGRDGRDAQGQ